MTFETEDRHGERDNEARRDEPRRGMLRRHPFALVGEMILLFVALPACYLSTDDAFIAARF